MTTSLTDGVNFYTKQKKLLKQATNVRSEFKISVTVGIVEAIKVLDRSSEKTIRIC